MTDLIGIFNAGNRKDVCKFPDLRWFLAFEWGWIFRSKQN